MKALTQKPAFTIIHCIMLHCLAQELNEVLKSTTPGQLLSDFGQRMYFPKGIIAQSAEAKKLGKTANATIGMTVSNGIPVVLPIIQKQLPDFTPQELVAYAPTEGNLELRNIWKEKILKKNPSLIGKSFSLPVVVPGLTAGISYLCDLFLYSRHLYSPMAPHFLHIGCQFLLKCPQALHDHRESSAQSLILCFQLEAFSLS